MITVNVNLIAFSSNKSVGTLIYTKRLFRQIFNMNHSGIQFVFYVQRQFDISDFNLPSYTEIVRVPTMNSPMVRRAYEHTFFRMKLKKADYLFTPYLTMPLLFTSSKQIVTIHDMVPFRVADKYSAVKLQVIKWETILASMLSYKIVTVSNNSKKDICEIAGASEDKVAVIYNFIRKDEVVVHGLSNPDVIKEFGFTKPFFIIVSTLQPGKNIERLIRAFSLFLREHPDFQLCIVGNKGWGYVPIYKEVKRNGLEESVIFTGYADDKNLDILYTHCYGVVYVSLYEGFGIPPLEGFYHKKAAVVSNNSSLPEVVDNAAVLVDPYREESIAEGLSKFVLVKDQLEKEVTNQTKKFSPSVIAREFLNLFYL